MRQSQVVKSDTMLSLQAVSTPRLIGSHKIENNINYSIPSIIVGSRTRSSSRTRAVSVSDGMTSEVSWQIVVGALAGVAPFVVAGIEFSKRIVQQRNCKVCRGSGLVLRDNKYYFRCPRCGGFLPWQSWRRFFTG